MAAPPADIKTLGRYDIQAVLGKGAMGVVYAGMDPRLHRKVAIKTILKSALDEDTAREYTMRFDREAQAVARLNHPNIVQVYDFGAEGDVAYIVMEFIQGKELKDFFDANERFDIKEAVHIMGELCEALHFAHEAGIIHRDIKPANVMIDNKGRVKLADFGVARITDADRSSSEKTQAGAIVGTPAYMSPEQIEGGEIDRRTDIFSAGIILYQFLTGEKPFTGTSTWTIAKKILQDEPVMPSRLNTNISPLFDAIIAKALAKNMTQRYQNARDLGGDLKNALEGKATTDESDKTIVGSLAFDAPLPPAALAGAAAGASGTGTGQTGTQEVELEFWRSIKDGNDADDFDLYVKQFPDGIYSALAKRKSAKLRGVADDTATKGLAAAEQEKRELEEAARREAEVKAKLAEEKAKLEEELAKREAEYQKRAADLEAKQAAEAKIRIEKEAAEKAAFEAKLAKREADLQVQLKKQEEEQARIQEELKKKEAETVKLSSDLRKKKGSPLVPIAIGLIVAAIGGGGIYYATRKPDTEALMAALEVAKKSNEQLIAARQGEQQAAKELELARQREAEAKASGDQAKMAQLAEETKRREAELTRQADLVKQKEAEAKAAVAKAEEAAKKAKDSEAQKKADLENKAKADKLAADKAAADKVVADRAAAEKAARAATDKAEADRSAAAAAAAAEKAAAAERLAAKAAPPAPVAAAAPKAAPPEAPRPKSIAMGAAERLALKEEEAARKAAEARGVPAVEARSGGGSEQLASVSPTLTDPGAATTTAAAPKESLFQQGKAAEASGNIKQAVRLYVRAVRGGEYEAAKALGDIFADGKGDVPKDYGESLKYYSMAEKHGIKTDRTAGRGR